MHERLLERVHLAQDVAVEHRYLIVPFEHGHERPGGAMVPIVGCSQRTSASAEQTAPSSVRTMGW